MEVTIDQLSLSRALRLVARVTPARATLPILQMEKSAGGGNLTPEMEPYILASRGVIVLFTIVCVILVRMAWKRNRYDDRKGFVLVDHSGEGGAA